MFVVLLLAVSKWARLSTGRCAESESGSKKGVLTKKISGCVVFCFFYSVSIMDAEVYIQVVSNHSINLVINSFLTDLEQLKMET